MESIDKSLVYIGISKVFFQEISVLKCMLTGDFGSSAG